MKQKNYYLTEEQITKGIKLCMNKVNQILNDVEILCKNEGHETTAVYLYTIALEEYGKSLLLTKSLSKIPEPKGIPVDITLFKGKQAHNLKFEVALNELPEECQIYQDVDLLTEQHKLPSEYQKHAREAAETQKILQRSIKRSDMVVVERIIDLNGDVYQTARLRVPPVTGRISFSLPFDFAVRKNLLYVNWDPENKWWNDDVTIDPYEIVADDFDLTKEVEKEKDEEKLFPEIVLIAIESFRTYCN